MHLFFRPAAPGIILHQRSAFSSTSIRVHPIKISGDIHLNFGSLAHLFKNNLSLPSSAMFLCRIIIYDKGIVIPRTWSACQHNFALAFLRAMLLDGYTCKSPPPLFGLHPAAPTHYPRRLTKRHGRFTRPHRLTTLRPAHL